MKRTELRMQSIFGEYWATISQTSPYSLCTQSQCNFALQWALLSVVLCWYTQLLWNRSSYISPCILKEINFFQVSDFKTFTLRFVHWCNLNFLPFLLFCIHFLYIAICFGCLFKIMKLYYPLKKPGYDSIIKTKDFIANAMSLILIGTTYRVEPLPKLCGVLYHTLLDWSWWSYTGSNGQLLIQGIQIFDCH